tara:strand:- start:71 stop:2368 length:2298 start_codon:yes stop_codon:yes gene_type:complete
MAQLLFALLTARNGAVLTAHLRQPVPALGSRGGRRRLGHPSRNLETMADIELGRDVDAAIKESMALASFSETSSTAAGAGASSSSSSSSSSGSSDAAIDCRAIGMGETHCDPQLAKALAHMQYPLRGKCGVVNAVPLGTDNMKCNQCFWDNANVVPENEAEGRRFFKKWSHDCFSTWGNNGFGSDQDIFLPTAMVASVFSGAHPTVFLRPTTKMNWWQNHDGRSSQHSPCPGQSWYECYFEPHTTCAIEAPCALLEDSNRAHSEACEPRTAAFVRDMASASDLSIARRADARCASRDRTDRLAARAGQLRPTGSRPPTQAELRTLRHELAEMRDEYDMNFVRDSSLREKMLATGTGKRKLGSLMWRIHIISLFFRPNDILTKHLDAAKKKLGYRSGGVGRNGRIAVHIRHSDYILESPETAVEAYCATTAKMLMQTKFTGIYLATDDKAITPATFKACVKREAAKRGWKLEGELHVAQQAYKRMEGSTEDQLSASGVNAYAMTGLVDTFLLAHCDAFVISGHSGFSYLSMLIALARGKAKHFHIMNCANSMYAHNQLANLDMIPTFTNEYDPVGVNACEGNMKTLLFQHTGCEAALKHPAFAKHMPSVVESRFSSVGSKVTMCTPDVIQYQGTSAKLVRRQCKMMCDPANNRRCSMLLPTSYATKVKPQWTEPGTAPWTKPRDEMVGATGCSLIEEITVEQCIALAAPQCSSGKWNEHVDRGGFANTFPCDIVGFGATERCGVHVYRDPSHHTYVPRSSWSPLGW